jgi:hypothetical protein
VTQAEESTAADIRELIAQLESLMKDEIPLNYVLFTLPVADASVGQMIRENDVLPRLLSYIRQLEEIVDGIASGTAFDNDTGLIWDHWIEKAKQLSSSLS